MSNDSTLDSILEDAIGTTKQTVAEIVAGTVVEAVEKTVSPTVDKKEITQYRPGVGFDVGTCFLVSTRQTLDGDFISKIHRNCLYQMDINEESTSLLGKSNYYYIENNGKFYIAGDDAISLVNVVGSGEILRCLKDGFLNPALKESSDLLFQIISSVVGDPIVKNECLCFSTPANPIDREADNLFHKMVLNGFFTKMGYNCKDINEAMAVCYNDNPKMRCSNGEEIPLTGISISFGAGLQNLSLSFKGMSLVEFSCTKSGDYIDEMTSKATGVSKSKIIRIKEKELDLDKINSRDRVQVALGIYYDDLIDRVVHNISNKFNERGGEFEGEIEIVIAGGTSLPNGFCKKFEDSIKKSNIPFKIWRVRHSLNPLVAVGQGSCLKAIANQKKQ